MIDQKVKKHRVFFIENEIDNFIKEEHLKHFIDDLAY